MKKVGPPENSVNPECSLAQKTNGEGGGGERGAGQDDIPSIMYEKPVKQQRIIK